MKKRDPSPPLFSSLFLSTLLFSSSSSSLFGEWSLQIVRHLCFCISSETHGSYRDVCSLRNRFLSFGVIARKASEIALKFTLLLYSLEKKAMKLPRKMICPDCRNEKAVACFLDHLANF